MKTFLIPLLASLASAATIHFDSLPSSTVVSGIPNNAASVLTNQLNADGILFGLEGVSAGVAVVAITTFNEISAPNVIVGLDAVGEIESFASSNIYFQFVVPGTSTPGQTDSLSFYAGDDCCDEDTFEIRAYSFAGALLDTQILQGNSWQFYSLALPGIHRIEVDNLSPHNAGFAIDDISFATPTSAVPEPTPIAMALIGLSLTWWKKHRN